MEQVCPHCGRPNPEYSAANAWACGVLGLIFLAVCLWLGMQDSVTIPSRSGARTVYTGWALGILVTQSGCVAGAALGVALRGYRGYSIAKWLVIAAAVLFVGDILRRV